MMRKVLQQSWLLSVLLLLLHSTHVGWAQGDVPRGPEATETGSVLDQVLRQGTNLEREKRWLDALSHYEKALRDYPEHAGLQDRLTLAQIHCDIARRYSDRSFQQLVSSVAQPRAMEMYAEVMRKIQVHYVDAPDWQDLLWRGTASVDVAVTKKLFIDQHLPHARPEEINAFRHELRRAINPRRVHGPEDSQAVVALCGETAWKTLHLEPSAVILEYACGAISALDPYSSYLTGSQLDDIYSQIEGSFVGLGVELKSDEGSLLIMRTIPGGPAERAGIRSGDRIVEVDGRPTRDVSTEEAADMLKGEQGSAVNVGVVSTQNALRHVGIRREQVEVPSVEDAQIIDRSHGIGYFRLANFQKTTSRDVDAALWKLRRDGMQSLIVDVRGNPGGLLTAAVEAADKFIQEGMIVSTKGRSPRENYDYQAHRMGTWAVPLIVLIDDETASASEIFAGAVRDHHRGIIMGQRSYGKGSVQGIFPLQTVRAGVRLTTAKFYSPNRIAISHHGVEPDVPIRQVLKPEGSEGRGALTLDQDPVITAARDAARRQIVAQRWTSRGES